ncbi:cation:proton antiporter [Allopontixanthobacter sp.]|uniref:cation:proton antiporter domain-containing protein n=1 Tax=Allopontixanthobacter sp. TaxID=2906452 RepID=UPI002ABA73EA|nr:cation:proton antiporter [Allopontixanthobacter sp.]MDZ4308668.1 cation:proton antiporter [Allopontixanthobacter sp.]
MEHEGASVLRDGVLLLGFALAFVLLFRRFGLGATLGYLIAGAVVGPQVLGLVGDAQQMITVAELGIVMLLFVVGLELDPSRLWRMKTAIFGLGLAQVAACGLAVSAVIYFAASYPLAAALAIGLPLGLSSTAQVLPMLQSSGRLRTPFGERAFAILLFQDLSIIPLITIVAAMSADQVGAGADAGMPGWQLALVTLAAIGGLIAAGRFVLRPLFRLIGNLNEREMFVVAGLFTVLGSAWVMEWLGLSTALGAFIAGVMLADTPYRHELEADIEPFRSILLGMFFLAVGMMLDLGAIAENPLFVIMMAIALIAVKSVIILGIGLAVGMAWRSALALGLLLSQGGEFGFVLFTQAREGGLISGEVSSLFGAIVTLSMATTPFLMMAASRMRQPVSKDGEREGPSLRGRSDGANALVIGFGRFGQTVAQLLVAAGVRVTLVDRDVEQIDVAQEFGSKVYYGDGTRLDLLRQAGAGESNLVIFAIDRDQLEPELLHGVKEAFPGAGIYVRAYDRRTLIKLSAAPIDHSVREVMESAVAMGRAALDGLGVSLTEIDRAESIFRERDQQRLQMQTEAGDLRAAKDMIFTQQAADTEAMGRDEAG